MLAILFLDELYTEWAHLKKAITELASPHIIHVASREEFVLNLQGAGLTNARVKARRVFSPHGKAEELVCIVADAIIVNVEIVYEALYLPLPLEATQEEVFVVESEIRKLGRYIQEHNINTVLLTDEGFAVDW